MTVYNGVMSLASFFSETTPRNFNKDFYVFAYTTNVGKVNQSHYRPRGFQEVPDFVTTAQDGCRLSALRTGRLYPQEMLLALISVTG